MPAPTSNLFVGPGDEIDSEPSTTNITANAQSQETIRRIGDGSARVSLDWLQTEGALRPPRTPQPRDCVPGLVAEGGRQITSENTPAERPRRASSFPDWRSAENAQYKDHEQQVIEYVVAPAQRRRTTSHSPWTPVLHFVRARIRPRDDGAHRPSGCWLPARVTAIEDSLLSRVL